MEVFIRMTLDESKFTKDELFMIPHAIGEMANDERIKLEIIDKEQILYEQRATVPIKP